MRLRLRKELMVAVSDSKYISMNLKMWHMRNCTISAVMIMFLLRESSNLTEAGQRRYGTVSSDFLGDSRHLHILQQVFREGRDTCPAPLPDAWSAMWQPI